MINNRLNSAEIILLLISSYFMVSQQHYDNEMRQAVDRHKRGEARVIPILLRETNNLQDAPFGGLQSLPRDGRFIVPQPNDEHYDALFSDVAKEIRKVVSEMQAASIVTTILPEPATFPGTRPSQQFIQPTRSLLDQQRSTQTIPTPDVTTVTSGNTNVPPPPVVDTPTIVSKKVLRDVTIGRIGIIILILTLLFLLTFNLIVPAIKSLVTKSVATPTPTKTLTATPSTSALGVTTQKFPGIGDVTFGLTDGTTIFSPAASANENCIYKQNQNVKGTSTITIVAVVTVSTTISDKTNSDTSSETGNEDLQGICARQRAYNEQNPSGATKLRVIIANLGTKANVVLAVTVKQVVQEIEQLAKNTQLIGVVGFGFSSTVLLGMPDLEAAGIPVISPSAASDELSDSSHIWKYFFRVVPTTNIEASYAVQFIASLPGDIHSVVVFSDSNDPYSGSLGTDFANLFNGRPQSHATIQQYTGDDTKSIDDAVMQIKAKPPQMIFCACFGNDFDQFFSKMRDDGLDTIPKMGGEALYELGGYTQPANYRDTYYIAFAYPDTVGIMCSSQSNTQLPQGGCSSDAYCGYANCATQFAQSSEPKNFNDFYCKMFNPHYTVQKPCANGNGYGQSRPGQHTLLSFDATSVLLSAYDQASQSGQQKVSLKDVRDHLATLQSFQGLSGQITFNTDTRSDVVSKAALVLYVDKCGHAQLVAVYGQFLENGSSTPQKFSINVSACKS